MISKQHIAIGLFRTPYDSKNVMNSPYLFLPLKNVRKKKKKRFISTLCQWSQPFSNKLTCEDVQLPIEEHKCKEVNPLKSHYEAAHKKHAANIHARNRPR